MADDKNNVLGAFNIQQYSRAGDRVTISLLINSEYDAGSDGIGAFKTDINFNPAILDYVAGSTQVSGMFGIPNEAEASSGSITITGIKSPNFTDFSTPVATLSFDIEDTSQAASIYTSDVTFEDIAVDTSTSYFNFGSLTLSGTIKSVSGYALPNASVTVTYGSSSSKPSVSSDGTFTADIDSGSDTTVTAILDYNASSKAITSLDALDALKLSVGLKPSSGTADAYDFIAADFNQDGKVTSLDALDILKNSVGLSTAQSPKWVFIDGDKDYSSITKNSVTYANGVSLTDVSADATANLKGILIGDVNASYVPETNNTATEGDDVLNGTSGDDTINGLEGNDTINGLTGNDILNGNGGDDYLEGNDGDDTLDGGDGDDTLDGGVGNDTYKYAYDGITTISDTSGIDTLHLTTRDADGNSYWGDGGYFLGDDLIISSNSNSSNKLVIKDAKITGNKIEKVTYYAADNSYSSYSLNIAHIGEVSDTESLLYFGTLGNDSITTGSAYAEVYLNDGDDVATLGNNGGWARGGNGNDTITAGEGAHNLYGYDGNDTLDGGAGDDSLNGGTGNDTLIGGSGNDILDGGDGNDRVEGGSGNDTIWASWGDDFVDGGEGVDTLAIVGTASSISDVTFNFATGSQGVTGQVLTEKAFVNIENFRAGFDASDKYLGSDWNYTIIGSSQNNRIETSEGQDVVSGAAGDDTLDGGAGNDTLDGGDGDDKLYGGAGDDTLNGGAGDDWLYGGAGTDVIIGGLGYDRIDYRESLAAIVVDFGTGIVSGSDIGTDTISGIERVIGTDFNDTLIGSDNVDYWESFTAGGGNDVVNGKGGNDTIWYGRSNSKITVDLTLGTVISEDGNDQLTSIEWVSATNFSDTLLGSDGDDGFHPDVIGDIGAGGSFETGAADVIDGRGGTDTVSYFNTKKTDTYTPNGIQVNLAVGTVIDPAGNTDQLTNIENINGTNFDDQIVGDSEANTLNGFDGNDTLEGGAGNDTLTGGSGADIFKFGSNFGNDTITDFVDGVDTLDYTGSATIGSSADNYKMYSFGDGSTITLSGVAAPNPNHHSFTSGENNFILVSSAKSYQDAVDYASGMGGTLATFNSSTKFEGFYNAVSNVISSENLTATTAADGGGAKYVWLGATDQVTEGTWIWANNEEMVYSNWGSGSLGSEPDNFNNQDGLALGLENWPSGSSNGAGYGDAGYWNDVDVSNQLFFVVEIA